MFFLIRGTGGGGWVGCRESVGGLSNFGRSVLGCIEVDFCN